MVGEESYGDVSYIDYAILKCLEDCSGPLWKKKIYESIMDRRDEFPQVQDTSSQTVGRHVDKLKENGLLESAIVSTEDVEEVKRSHMIGFTLTEKGEKALSTKREAVLRHKVASVADASLLEPFGDIPLEKTAIVELMCDEFGISGEERDIMVERLDVKDLVIILALYFFKKNVRQHLDDERLQDMAKVALSSDRLREEFAMSSITEKIRDSGKQE